MYLLNSCSPLWAIRPKDEYNVTIIRKAMMAELMLVFLIYVIIDLALIRVINKLRLEDKKENNSAIEAKTRDHQLWKTAFMQSFGEHSLAVGFVMCFAPYSFETGLCCSYLLLFVFNIIKRFKYDGDSQAAQTLVRIVNLALLVCALIGISRCGVINGQCTDIMY